ncbi:class I SAM-dependent methyltransferase [Geminocystis sp. GBBB08]|uniref:class I SAM-dependent methyltransferase n=1 Tax=Geminocystis sp. GBBB08 TaxID=2604140 RepID=UPI0027E2AB5C|nr:class I SAM-dependent methyltransferase [Geminocystis sp. GBBB08]MBL1209985.1 class I SAM-dependent methyltransferase [Geminocystis sp. GBBB08]
MKQLFKEKIDKFLLNVKIPYLSFLVSRNKELEKLARDLENIRQKQQNILDKLGTKFRSEIDDKDSRYFMSKNDTFQVEIKPFNVYPHTFIKVINKENIFEEKLLYSHLGLAKLITDYEFNDVLDIGSRNGTSARLFSFLGKNVTTIEMSADFEADYVGDYLDVSFPQKFDAIWCSHVLEHQRNIGTFLDKIYQDLKEDGILAVTVPSSLCPLMIGHPNIFTPLHLVYHLILAGFDCRNVRIKYYDWQFTILLQKKSNGIKSISLASTHYPDSTSIALVEDLLNYFPLKIPKNGHIWGEIESLNWN